MSGYNPNYFDRKLVNSMKNAISQIVVKEQFPGTAEGQPGLGLGQISDLELQKRMRNKKNTSIFNKNPKQSKEYLELEAEANRRAAAKSQTQTPAQTQAPAPTTTTAPVSSGGGKSLFAPDTQKSSTSGSKPGPSALATNKEKQISQTTANKTGIPTALPTNVTPGTMGMTDMDGNPISVDPQKSSVGIPDLLRRPGSEETSVSGTKPAPKPGPSALPRDMSIVPGKSFRDRFSMGIGNIPVSNVQLQSFKQAKETAAKQNTSGMGAYSPKDANSQVRGEVADYGSFTSSIGRTIAGAAQGGALGLAAGFGAGALVGGAGAIPGAVIGGVGGAIAGALGDTPKSKPINATKVQGPAASQQELQAAQNAAPAPANWASNYAARVAAARARAKR
jgi:hypothetical protein